MDGAVIIPLVSVGVGFGVGEGAGDAKSGPGAGTGGGGGVKPIAVLIADKDGVRLETVKGAGSQLGKIAESWWRSLERRSCCPKERSRSDVPWGWSSAYRCSDWY